MVPPPYDPLAPLYDLENADFKEDLPYWLHLASQHPGPILELGCGTGRVSLHLGAAGHTLLGVDHSPAMLARARAKLAHHPQARANVTLQQATLTDFDAPAGGFALAILPFNTFMHLPTPADQRAALDRIHAALIPNGGLVFDIGNPYPVFAADAATLAALTLERTFTDPHDNRTIQQFSSQRLDRRTQQRHVTWLYDIITPDGALQRLTVAMVFRESFPAELEHLLARSGFQLQRLLGDYHTGIPFTEDAPRLVVEASAI